MFKFPPFSQVSFCPSHHLQTSQRHTEGRQFLCLSIPHSSVSSSLLTVSEECPTAMPLWSSAVCVFLYASACFPSPHSESNLSKAAAENQAFSHLTQKPRASHCPSRPLSLSSHIHLTTAWAAARDGVLALLFTDRYLRLFKLFFKIQNRKFPLSLYHTHTRMLFNLYIWILLFQLRSKLGTIACKLYKSLGRDCIWRQSKWHFSAK